MLNRPRLALAIGAALIALGASPAFACDGPNECKVSCAHKEKLQVAQDEAGYVIRAKKEATAGIAAAKPAFVPLGRHTRLDATIAGPAAKDGKGTSDAKCR
jgi:hypothetical protein